SSLAFLFDFLFFNQVHPFYGTVRYMTGAQTDRTVQEHLIEKHMLLPNPVWDCRIQQAAKNVDVLKDPEAITQLGGILKTNPDAENFVPPLLGAVLVDYQRNVPAAREREVLSAMAVIANKLGGHTAAEIPQIFDAGSECTLNMINKEFAGEDTSDLFLEEREAALGQAREEEHKLQMSVPGILNPREIPEDM
ncbi:hypothetical protein ASZ78_006424, partial [Callipepla squamata]